jgi:hypothetical protein
LSVPLAEISLIGKLVGGKDFEQDNLHVKAGRRGIYDTATIPADTLHFQLPRAAYF